MKIVSDDMSPLVPLMPVPNSCIASLLVSPGKQVIGTVHDMHNHGACEVERVWMLCVCSLL